MEIVNFGHFKERNVGGFIVFENEDCVDWYDMRRGLTTWDDQGRMINAIYGAWAVVDPDTQILVNVQNDPSKLVPWDKIVLGVDADVADLHPGMIYTGTTLQSASAA